MNNGFQVCVKLSLEAFNNKVKDVLKKCNKIIDPKIRFKLTVENIQMPKLYGLIKCKFQSPYLNKQ